MNILHLSKFYPPDPGGIEQAVAQLAEGAAARGHQVRVVSATGSSWVRDPGKRITEPPRAGVVVARLPTYGVYWSQPLAPGYLAAARWPADVVYVHRPHPLADAAMWLGPERRTIVFHHSDVQRQQAARALYRPLARSVARRAGAVVVATRSHLNYAQDLGTEGRAKARVIPYGVDVGRYAPTAAPPRPAAFPPPSAGPVAVFVGRLVGYKGLEVLIRAVAGSALNVVIVGSGPLAPVLEEDVRRQGLSQQVRFAGEVVPEELPAYFQAADYAVLPSTSAAEMFGIALLEAMACGRPVISTVLGTGVDEVNRDNETGLVVPPGDPGALRAAMDRLARDAALRARLGEAARRHVERAYSVERMIEAHMALCQELVDGRGRGG